jgi:hypothetical protein
VGRGAVTGRRRGTVAPFVGAVPQPQPGSLAVSKMSHAPKTAAFSALSIGANNEVPLVRPILSFPDAGTMTQPSGQQKGLFAVSQHQHIHLRWNIAHHPKQYGVSDSSSRYPTLKLFIRLSISRLFFLPRLSWLGGQVT